MKNSKLKFALILLLNVIILSCSEEKVAKEKITIENKILIFNSENEIQSKINEIKTFKELLENELIQIILSKSNLNNLTFQDIQKLNINDKKNIIDEKKILEDLIYYHSKRLKNIYKERLKFNFTSIQSIADEINSLKILDNKKAEEIYNSHKDFLIKTEFIVTPKNDNNYSYIANSNNELILKNEKIILSLENSNRAIPRNLFPNFTEGVLFSSNNGLFVVTWHSGVYAHNGTSGDSLYNKLSSYVKVGYTYVLYPSWFYPTPNSITSFGMAGFKIECPDTGIGYKTTSGSISTQEISTSYNYCRNAYKPLRGNISATVLTALGGTTIGGSGTSSFQFE